MSDISDKLGKSLKDLGISDEAGVESLMAEVRAELDRSTLSGEEFRVRWLGRKQGYIGAATDNWLKSAPPALKRSVGKAINQLKARAEAALSADAAELSPAIDITLPGVRRTLGSRHPVQLVMQEIEEIFRSMGYSVETGPEVETDYYNFEALNFPPGHPARDTQDTFFLAGDGNKLLRTHTSPVQIRTMESQKPPVRAVVLGKVYRRDAPDASHSFMFHQMECFAVDTNITLCDLKGTLNEFIRRFFGPKVKTRFRPSFFPFTEPSAELDISCLLCSGSGCSVCKRTGWVELLGSGMIDPAVYGFVGYDPAKVSGFAFGTGADRLALMKYGINDIQLLWQGDKRFLHPYR